MAKFNCLGQLTFAKNDKTWVKVRPLSDTWGLFEVMQLLLFLLEQFLPIYQIGYVELHYQLHRHLVVQSVQMDDPTLVSSMAGLYSGLACTNPCGVGMHARILVLDWHWGVGTNFQVFSSGFCIVQMLLSVDSTSLWCASKYS